MADQSCGIRLASSSAVSAASAPLLPALVPARSIACSKAGNKGADARLGAGALDRLLDVLSRHHAEGDRHAGLEAHLRNALGGLAADQLVVAG